MKDYRKLLRKLIKSGIFEVDKGGKSTSEKIIHKPSGEFYLSHPHDKAVNHIKRWAKKLIK